MVYGMLNNIVDDLYNLCMYIIVMLNVYVNIGCICIGVR